MINKHISIKLSFLTAMILSVAVLFMVGCQKGTVESVTLDISLDSVKYKFGDSINFRFSGYADNIAYYSGEKIANYPTVLGNRYEFYNRTLAKGKAILQFQSLLQNSGQLNTLSVLASKNFNGKYDSASIVAATWVDITNRVILSDGTSTAFTSSSNIDVSDFKDSAVFFAFRYKAVTGKTQPKWTINNLNLTFYARGIDSTNRVTNDTFTVATLNPVWKAVNILNKSQNWSVSTTQLSFAGTTSTSADNEDWVISKDLYLNRVPTDKPTSIIKTYTDAMFTSFRPPPYTSSGKYKVTFVSSNASYAEQKGRVKELEVEISP